MLRLIWKNAWRSRRRTVLTILSVAVSLFLLSTMLCYLSSGEQQLESAGASLRVVTRHQTSLTFFLPEAYTAKIAAVPHVTVVQGCVWWGGQIKGKEMSLFMSTIAADLEPTEKMWDDYRFEPGVLDKMRGELRGAVIARRALERAREQEGWEIGKTVTMTSPIFKHDIELLLLGTCEGPDESIVLFRRDYLEKVRGNPGQIGYFWARVDKAENIPGVCRDVDAMFANSESETKTETEKAFMQSFMSMMGNIEDLVRNIGLAVVAMILMVAANTMAMVARERTTEHAVMRCLGFTRGRIAVLFISESVLISLLGAAVGVGGAVLLYRPGKFDAGGMAPFFHMTPSTTATGLLVALGVGLVAGAAPAIAAARRSVVDGLRRVD
ncbi:MAG: ABC-type transport system involved in lipoprotein release permease [Planctomycetota bacterium]|nr:MAG: ABC-type transport system involved in lipoprotein release permease [Planctomycetota bacterium]